jgi:hypothetical protein
VAGHTRQEEFPTNVRQSVALLGRLALAIALFALSATATFADTDPSLSLEAIIVIGG